LFSRFYSFASQKFFRKQILLLPPLKIF
jgi:hypothetical protein